MANGMSSIIVGTSGLQSAQAALNTTAHNLANIDTKGYTRQQISFSDVQYVSYNNTYGTPITSQYGLGVAVSEIRRIRDEFIDAAYRSENSRLGYYSSQYDAVEEVESQFGEINGITYQKAMTNLYNAINELSKEPSSTVKRSALIQTASAFITRSNTVYQGLKDYQATLNVEVSKTVSRINEIGDSIYALNKNIASIEATGRERANDLRDQRDVLLDELSEYINISYKEQKNGEVEINAESVPFVTTTMVSKMSMRTSDQTDLVIPTWPAFNQDVYAAEDAYKQFSDTDKGSLKGLMIARGNVSVDYTDVPVKPVQKDYDLTTVEGKEAYERDYAEYLEKQDYYNKNIEPSVILSALAGIDKLVNGIAEKLNEVFCPQKELVTTEALTDANGKELVPNTYEYTTDSAVLYMADGTRVNGIANSDGTFSFSSEEKLYSDAQRTTLEDVDSYIYSILDMEKTDYGMDDDHTVGEALFARDDTERYTVIKDENGNDMYVYNNVNSIGYRSTFTLGNISMNENVVQDISKIPLTTYQGKEDMAKGQELMDVWTGAFASLNPESYAVSNFDTYYNDFISEFAIVGSVLDSYVSHQQTMVDGYDDQRLQTEGVSSDEELQKMIKYQQAYNAASRYINVVSQMLEHLVTSL